MTKKFESMSGADLRREVIKLRHQNRLYSKQAKTYLRRFNGLNSKIMLNSTKIREIGGLISSKKITCDDAFYIKDKIDLNEPWKNIVSSAKMKDAISERLKNICCTTDKDIKKVDKT
jgi:hypothetical protein